MLSKIKFAVLAASLVSAVGLASPALAATHAHHARPTLSRDVRAEAIEPHQVLPEVAPDAGLENYQHRFCCS